MYKIVCFVQILFLLIQHTHSNTWKHFFSICKCKRKTLTISLTPSPLLKFRFYYVIVHLLTQINILEPKLWTISLTSWGIDSMRPKFLGESPAWEKLSKYNNIFVGDEFIFSQKHRWIMLGNDYEFCGWKLNSIISVHAN